MTNLSRIDLPTSSKVELATLGVATRGSYGGISYLSETYGVSRPTIYAAVETAEALLERHFGDTGESRATQYLVTIDEAQLRRTVVALRVVGPYSIRAIETLLPCIYPGLRVSYGKIQGILIEAEELARAHNRTVDLAAIDAAALDEMYSQGQPVLAGVDLVSGYLFALALRSSRSADDWAEVLREGQQQGLELKKVVKDAALGIAAGVRQVYPQADQRDDCFHAQYEMGKVHRWLERRAYGAIAAVEEAKAKLKKFRATGRGNRAKLGARLRVATQRCDELLELHDRFEQAMRRAQEAMEVVDPHDGILRRGTWMQAELEQAGRQMMSLNQEKCRKVGLYLFNRAPGLASHARQVADHMAVLTSLWGHEAVESVCLIHRLLSDLGHHYLAFRHWESRRRLGQAYAGLQQQAGKYTDALLADVNCVLAYRLRASSAIEGFNAALRPHLYVHKGVSEGFLELFRACYNLKTRRWGRHKGTSAHEWVTGEKVDDWLTVLGFPPSSAVN